MRFMRCAKGSTLEPGSEDETIAISVQHLTKQFQIPLERRRTIYSRLAARLQGKAAMYRDFSALDDVSFHIRHGDTVGVIGPNGSGKSTLLKLIAGVLYPDRGCVLVQGRVAPFLELGVGFEPELTARENIYLYGAIMGMTRREIDRKYWDILNFAELKKVRGHEDTELLFRHASPARVLRRDSYQPGYSPGGRDPGGRGRGVPA